MCAERFDDPRESAPENGAADARGPEAVRRLQAQLEELAEYVRLYLAARGDAVLAKVRALALVAVVAAVALVIVCALLAAAAVIGLLGLAQLAGQGLGSTWAGNLVTGLGVLAISLGGLLAAIAIMKRGYRRRMVKKYAGRHATERRRFGHDAVAQAARAAERG